MTPKYKVGDKVKILNGRYDNAANGCVSWVPSMDEIVGQIGSVKIVDECDNTYVVAVPGCRCRSWWYRENWLAPADGEGKKTDDGVCKVLVSSIYTPKHIYKGKGKTVLLWADGTKTIVKRAEGEPDNDYAAFTAALAIKLFGTNSEVNRIVRQTELVQKRKKK